MTELETPQSAADLAKPRRLKRHHRRGSRFSRRVRRFLGHINWFIVVTLVVGVSAVIMMSLLVVTADATNRVWSSWSNLSRALSSVSNKPGTELKFTDFERLKASVYDMVDSLGNAQGKTNFLRPFAASNADLAAGLGALDAAHELTLAASDILNGLQPTLFFLAGGDEDETVMTQVSSGERLVELLRLGQGRFLSAGEHLDNVYAKIKSLDLGNVSPDLLLVVEDLITYHDQLRAISDIVTDAPDLLTVGLGLDETQSYLVLSQNSDELRPSGGYISTYGWMNVHNARIEGYDYSPTTDTSPNPPDTAPADQVPIPEWWIPYGNPIAAAWDGSWYADFPSTAKMAAWYYDSGGNPQSPVDGVIGIDLVGFEYIIEALGSVTVPGYDEVVTRDNFREVVYKIRAEGEGDRPHKRFLVDLYRQVLADWRNLKDSERGTALLGATLRALQEKHIMLYFTNEQLNEAVSTLGWSGAQIPAVAHDYLMVADANLGNKSNRSIVRQLTYDVEITSDGALRSRATVAYDYRADLAENDPAVQPAHYRYQDYYNLMQVFTPAGSALTGTDNLGFEPYIVADATRTIFIVQTEVKYNTGERFQFSYTTPTRVEELGAYRRYRLLLQKQPGMIAEAVSVQVRLPASARVIDAAPELAASYNLDQPILEFRIDLVADQWIEVIYAE